MEDGKTLQDVQMDVAEREIEQMIDDEVATTPTPLDDRPQGYATPTTRRPDEPPQERLEHERLDGCHTTPISVEESSVLHPKHRLVEPVLFADVYDKLGSGPVPMGLERLKLVTTEEVAHAFRYAAKSLTLPLFLSLKKKCSFEPTAVAQALSYLSDGNESYSEEILDFFCSGEKVILVTDNAHLDVQWSETLTEARKPNEPVKAQAPVRLADDDLSRRDEERHRLEGHEKALREQLRQVTSVVVGNANLHFLCGKALDAQRSSYAYFELGSPQGLEGTLKTITKTIPSGSRIRTLMVQIDLREKLLGRPERLAATLKEFLRDVGKVVGYDRVKMRVVPSCKTCETTYLDVEKFNKLTDLLKRSEGISILNCKYGTVEGWSRNLDRAVYNEKGWLRYDTSAEYWEEATKGLEWPKMKVDRKRRVPEERTENEDERGKRKYSNHKSYLNKDREERHRSF